MLLFVGLGNPGAGYAGNRHNLGFMAVDEITRHHGFSAPRTRFQGHLGDGRIKGERVLVLKPGTFMNESGRAVGEALRYFRLDPGKVYVFHDDLDLAPGKVRVKLGGGHAGHNGVRNIDSHIGQDYWRVRMGIGRAGAKADAESYVLKDFTKADRTWVEPLLEAVASAAPLLVADDPPGFMSKVSVLTRPPEPIKNKTAGEVSDDGL